MVVGRARAPADGLRPKVRSAGEDDVEQDVRVEEDPLHRCFSARWSRRERRAAASESGRPFLCAAIPTSFCVHGVSVGSEEAGSCSKRVDTVSDSEHVAGERDAVP
jgi:hypothetical protein